MRDSGFNINDLRTSPLTICMHFVEEKAGLADSNFTPLKDFS